MKTNIDEFESMFRRADRESFVFQDVVFSNVTMVTDRNLTDANRAKTELASFLPRLPPAGNWTTIGDSDFHNVGQLLSKLKQQSTDLIVTYRHLQEDSDIPQHSLGVYLDVLTQATDVPVLVLPGTASSPKSLAGKLCDDVMIVTDHISGDDRLVNCGVGMCADGGRVFLCHIEDDAVFERYMHVIECIPEIDSELARELIAKQLHKEAADFIATCVEELGQQDRQIQFESAVEKGHRLNEYKRLIDSHAVDLLVANTKDEDQQAMHGLAYAITVEMLDTALLLL